MRKTVKGWLICALAIALGASPFGGIGGGRAGAAAPEPQTYTATVTKDTFVRQTNPSSPTPDYSSMPYGGDGGKTAYLNVKGTNTTSPREAYLQFDLTDYPEHITSAVLYLYGENSESATASAAASVYGLDQPGADAWGESTLTWNDKPGPGANRLGSVTFPGKGSSAWTSLDVTPFVQGQLAGDKTASFAVAGSNALIRIESRTTYVEDAPGHKAKAYLRIEGTPALKTVALAADRTSLGIGETANLSVTGLLDTNEAADLTDADEEYASDGECVVIDDAGVGSARAVCDGSAVVTAAVTLGGVTRTGSATLHADGSAPGEVTGLAGGLANGEFRLTWQDPADADLASVAVYDGSELLGAVAKGVQELRLTGLTPGETYTLTARTVDTAGNVSAGASAEVVYEEPIVLRDVRAEASADVVKPGQTVSFGISAGLSDGTAADLSSAEVDWASDSGSLIFPDGGGSSVAEAVYAGAARVHAVVTLDGVTRESPPVLVRVYPVAQDEYDALRLKYAVKLTGYDPDDPYDPNDPLIRAGIDAQDARTQGYWESMRRTTYDWADLQSTTKSANLSTASDRLAQMSKQWATYGSRYYQNEELLHDLAAGWEQFYEARYNESKSLYDNWYDWLVNVPNHINDSMALLYDAIPYTGHPDLVGKLNRAIDKFNPTVTRTGANRVYISKVLILRGIIGKNGAAIQAGSDGLSAVFPYVESGDGFYADGSFVQHDYFPYAGSYGRTLLADISDTLWLVSDSTWDNNDPQRSHIYSWYFDTFEPIMVDGQIINAVDGREITRDYSYIGFGVINALLSQIEMAGNPYAERQKSAVKFHIEHSSLSSYLRAAPIWNIERARQILDDPTVQAYQPPLGNFNFFNQDNVVQRGGNWLYSISMHSDRIANYETANNENLKGWYESDGMTQLYLDPLDYLATYWATVDPHRLPGITVDRDESRPPATSANRPSVDVSKYAGDGELMDNSWTGGVSLDGQYGIAGMDFKQHDYADMDVSAKKSWFLFDDEIVALGAGIDSSSGRPIETVVDNRTLNSAGDNALAVDGAEDETPMGAQEQLADAGWIHLEGTGGYVFPGGADVNALREERAGKSKDVNEKFFTPGDDDFNSTVLSSNWSWLRGDSSHRSLTGTGVAVKTQQGTMRGSVGGDAGTTKNMLLTAAPKEDFYVTAKLTFAPSHAGQEAGIVLRKDDDNYVSVAKSADGITAVNELGGEADVREFPLAVQGDVYLKIDKSGDRYAVYAAANETSWGDPLAVFESLMAGEDRLNIGLGMGLYAQNGEGDASVPEIDAAFDFFHFWHTRNYMTLWLDHGVAPQDAGYSYIQLPLKSAAETAAYSADPDVAILANTKEVQAAADTTLGVTGLNFWQRGELGRVKANNPSSAMLKEAGDELAVAVSDPTHKQSRIGFELKYKATGVIQQDSSVHVLQLSPTIKFEVDTTAAPGQAHTARFAIDPDAPAADWSTPQLASVAFDKTSRVLEAGTSLNLALSGLMDDNGPADLDAAQVHFASSNGKVASVNNGSGRLKAKCPGTAVISATVTLGGVTKTAKLELLVPSDTPETATLTPTADTFVRSGIYENDTYGAESKLNVKHAGGDDGREAYFRFDLSDVEGEIESATLVATGRVDETTGTYVDTVVKPILGSWDETQTRFTSKPALGRALDGARFTNTDSAQSFDVTEYVREQLRGGSAVELALVQDVLVGRKMYVYSREDASRKPQLVIVTHRFDEE